MREFDYNGLLMCEYQGKIFEKSLYLNCSTPIFMRRFMHCDFLKRLDKNESTLLALDVNEAIDSILEQYGDSSYGKEKYSRESMFWIGYMYRYISYTTGNDTPFIMKTFDYRLMNEVYYPYHSQDPSWVVESLLEIKKLDKNYLDKNYRLKMIMKEKGEYQKML